MTDYSITIDAAGSTKDNERDRIISVLFPYGNGSYKTISSITRRGGIWCNCGGTSQSVTLSVYDQMLTGTTVIKNSNTVECRCYGTGPSDANYAQTSFTNWTQEESNAAVKAWENGTLIIKRIVTIKAYTSGSHGSPVFRDGYYSDVITISGATLPFTQYGPTINVFDVFRSDDGINENPESTTVYAKISLSMNDTTGLSDSPKLLIYYDQGKDPTLSSSNQNIGSAFGLDASSLNVEKTMKLPGTWSYGADYYFLLYFSAGEEVAIGKLDMVPRTTIPLYIAENNNGVSIGQYSTATEESAKFECNWPAYLYGGIAQIGDGSGSLLELMGIQAGSNAGTGMSSGNVQEYEVTFAKPYSEAPVVVIGLQLSGDYATNYRMGRISVALINVSTTKFTVRAYSATENDTQVNVGFNWAAFGKLA